MTSCTFGGQEYSEGSELCQEGRIKKCVKGEWRDTSRDCGGSAQNRDQIEALLARYQRHGEEPPQLPPASDSDPQAEVRLVTRFIDESTLRTFSDRVNFRAARTRGNACIGQLDPGDYTVGLPDIEYFEEPPRRCPGNLRNTIEIRYLTG